MKQYRILLPLACALIVSMASAQDFRDVSWGATMEQVKASEQFTLMSEDENTLVFNGQVNTKTVNAVYEFLPNGQLSLAGYLFDDTYTNRNTYIEDYEEVNVTLERLYGEPKTSDTYWSDDLYKDDPQSYGMAVSVGHVTYQAVWETETTLIRHTLNGNDFEISHGVVYNSLELSDETEQQEQETEDDAF